MFMVNFQSIGWGMLLPAEDVLQDTRFRGSERVQAFDFSDESAEPDDSALVV